MDSLRGEMKEEKKKTKNLWEERIKNKKGMVLGMAKTMRTKAGRF